MPVPSEKRSVFSIADRGIWKLEKRMHHYAPTLDDIKTQLYSHTPLNEKQALDRFLAYKKTNIKMVPSLKRLHNRAKKVISRVKCTLARTAFTRYMYSDQKFFEYVAGEAEYLYFYDKNRKKNLNLLKLFCNKNYRDHPSENSSYEEGPRPWYCYDQFNTYRLPTESDILSTEEEFRRRIDIVKEFIREDAAGNVPIQNVCKHGVDVCPWHRSRLQPVGK